MMNNEQNFQHFLLHNKGNRIMLYMAATAIIIQFVIFKYIYPFASFLYEDSFTYIEAAANNTIVSTHPIGYSRFLRFLSVFTYSDTVLVAVQYLFIQTSAIFLLFTLFYFYKAGKIVQYTLLAFMVFNPLFLYLGNLISRDCLFTGLSMIWFALMLWIVYRPSNKIILWHAIVVFIAFTVRHHAIIYPFITILAFWLSNLPLRTKLAGAGAGIFLCSLYLGYSGIQYKKITGHWQPVPAFGWLLANNAMYMYKHIPRPDQKPVPNQFRELDKSIRLYQNATHNVMFYPFESNEAGSVYLWESGSPLLHYRNNVFKNSIDTTTSELTKWAGMGPLYTAYGMYLIRKYPWQYLANFAAYGAKKYFAPSVEYLKRYNMGNKEVNPIATTWFRYKSDKVYARMGNGKVWILDVYPYLSGIMNMVLFFGLIYYWLLKNRQYNRLFNKLILLTAGTWFINALFTILLSVSTLRLQAFPVLLTTTFALLLTDWMVQLMRSMKSEARNVTIVPV